MVGPDSEATGAVRHMSRMFVTGANLSVPFATIVLRKGYGLGAQAMAGGSFKAPLFCIAWPTGEFGGMNLEGAVRLGQRRELEAIEDPEEREREFQAMVERMYQYGKAREHREPLRDRRRDRPRRLPPLDHDAARDARPRLQASPRDEETPEYRHVVARSGSAATAWFVEARWKPHAGSVVTPVR